MLTQSCSSKPTILPVLQLSMHLVLITWIRCISLTTKSYISIILEEKKSMIKMVYIVV